MRRALDVARLADVLEALARAVRSPLTIYLVGGATAVRYGWRVSTIDLDLHVAPDSDDLLRAIPELKDRLEVNIELASPLDFLPALPGWQDRSPFVAQLGLVTVRQFDLYAQALAKLERGFDQDLADVAAMVDRGLVRPDELIRLYAAIEPAIYRFPAVDPSALRAAVEHLRDRP